MNPSGKLYALLVKLISDAQVLLKSSDPRFHPSQKLADPELVRKWANELTLFKSIAGDVVKPWHSKLQHDAQALVYDHIEQPLSALETIKYAADQGLLVRYKDLVLAEAFADLSDQGRYLFTEGYFLAAGVLFRAVLEEKLRSLCQKHNCNPNKPRPTISDLNIALYGSTTSVYDKNMMHHITALAGIGNDAAHNKPGLQSADVKRLIDGVSDFLVRYSN